MLKCLAGTIEDAGVAKNGRIGCAGLGGHAGGQAFGVSRRRTAHPGIWPATEPRRAVANFLRTPGTAPSPVDDRKEMRRSRAGRINTGYASAPLAATARSYRCDKIFLSGIVLFAIGDLITM